jgi:hypothetical protein
MGASPAAWLGPSIYDGAAPCQSSPGLRIATGSHSRLAYRLLKQPEFGSQLFDTERLSRLHGLALGKSKSQSPDCRTATLPCREPVFRTHPFSCSRMLAYTLRIPWLGSNRSTARAGASRLKAVA